MLTDLFFKYFTLKPITSNLFFDSQLLLKLSELIFVYFCIVKTKNNSFFLCYVQNIKKLMIIINKCLQNMVQDKNVEFLSN